MVASMIDETARSRNHLWFAGMTYHGADLVEVFESASSYAAM